jgi:AcrR family transcriptional regulator
MSAEESVAEKTVVDQRVQRTQSWIVDSFNGLAMQRPYDDIQVADIVSKAGVGRSTFYEHFRNKDDVLRLSIAGMMEILADVVVESCCTKAARCVIEHFADQRSMALAFIDGATGPQITLQLAELIETRLATIAEARSARFAIPIGLAAQQVARSVFGLIRAWLDASMPCSSADLVTALQRTSVHSVAALLVAGR